MMKLVQCVVPVLGQIEPAADPESTAAFVNLRIPTSTGYIILGAFVVLLSLLLLWLWIQIRWIRIRAAVTLVLPVAGVPVVNVFLEPYGVSVAITGAVGWLTVVCTTAVALVLLYIELDFQRGDRGVRLFREFHTVCDECFLEGRNTHEIAQQHGIRLDRVEMLLACMTWMEERRNRET
jgi:hypothetical protein